MEPSVESTTIEQPPDTVQQRHLIRFMLLTGLLVGTLDGAAAVIDFLLTYHGNPMIAFQYIAGGILGAKAFSGGLPTALLGIFLHYFIATSWTVLFFLLYPRLKLLRENWILIGVLYAVFVWLAMNLGVRPLSRVPSVPWTAFKVIKSAAILMITVGLPVSFFTKSFFNVNREDALRASLFTIMEESRMTTISDDFMRQMMTKSKDYCAVILKATAKRNDPGVDKIIWEHGRRNFALRADGVLSIVCPVRDGSEIAGIGIFNGTVEEIETIMDGDPGVQAGVFVYEIHPCRGFPGDSLP